MAFGITSSTSTVQLSVSAPSSISLFTLWLVVSQDDKPFLKHTLLPLAHHKRIKEILVIHTGHRAPVDIGDLNRVSNRIREYHQNFGEGKNIPIHEGGFDQVAARNFAMNLCALRNAEWVIQLDADELLVPELFDTIPTVVKPEVLAFRLSRYELVAEDQYADNDVASDKHYLHNSRIRIWRLDKKRYERCSVSQERFPNPTRHCGIDFNDLSESHVVNLPGEYLLHFHSLLKKGNLHLGHSVKKLRSIQLSESLLREINNLNSPQAARRTVKLASPVSIFPPSTSGSNGIVFFPLRGIAFPAQQEAIDTIQKITKGSLNEIENSEDPTVAALGRNNLLTSGEDEEGLPSVSASTYAPTEATLLLTDQCNLGCSYCYSSAQKDGETMTWNMARAAIELVAANARASENRSFSIRYLGGGEPTVAWRLLEQCSHHALKLSHDYNLNKFVRLITNGTLLTRKRCQQIKKYVDFVTLSFDVLPDFQINRPFANGKSTQSRVIESMRYLTEYEVPFHARATITRDSAKRLVEMVEYLRDNTACSAVRFEPVSEVGRYLESNEEKPSQQTFVEQFLAARKIGKASNIEVTCKQFTNLDRTGGRFCEAEFSISPSGLVSACHRYSRDEHSGIDFYRYGQFDGDEFIFDQEKIRTIRGINVHAFRECDNCPARFNCAGGCTSARTHDGTISDSGPLCDLTRALLRASLEEKLGKQFKKGY